MKKMFLKLLSSSTIIITAITLTLEAFQGQIDS